MIFYFSGTGNSRWVAQTVATTFSEKIVEIGQAVTSNTTLFALEENERVGFVFPVYSWGVPPIVKQFIQRLAFENYSNQLIYGIFTCGDECGYTNRQFLKLLTSKGWKCHHIYSVQMPNNYIVLPKFDIDDKVLQDRKKKDAIPILNEIIAAISADKKMDCYIKGSMSFLKSKILYPLFCTFLISSKSFYFTDRCIGCEICAEKCSVGNILIENKRPVWKNDNCTQCLACIHYCPERAIEFGKATINKGRYTYH